MSGLAGIFCLDGRPVDRPALDRMAEAAPHLGPDGISLSLSGPIGLLHFQSITTPEAVGEVQPLSAADAGWILVFDGRLDNRDDLRSSLPASHRPWVNAPDAAFLLAAFAVWGEECPQKLVGDFAFALWQSRERRLFCARSLKGFCPFVWWSDGRTFLFASEVRQIFAGGGMARRLNEGFIGEILACAPTSVTDTPWEGISHLPPGQAMTVETHGMRKWRWHQGPFPEIRYKDDRDYEAHFRHLLGQALQSSLRSVGPVAMDLSGGLDSSSLVCLAAEGQKSGVAQPSILPFSLVFPGEPQDESGWIDLVAAHTGLEPVRVQPPSYEWDFWRATTRASMELAFRPNMASRRALLAEMQTRGCGVVVSGGGGDDWLRGSHAHWPDLARSGQWAELWHQACASEAIPLSVLGALRRFVGAGVLPLVSRRNRERLLYGRAEGVVPPWIAPGWARAICLADRIHGAERLPALSGLGQRWLYEPNLLRASFLQSAVRRLHAVYRVEQRNPLHDLRLIEFILGVPGDQFRRQGQKKSLLRRALRDTLPERLRQRQDKAEFSRPVRDAISDLGLPLPLPHLRPRGWIREEALFSEGTYIMAAWNAVALDMFLGQTLNQEGINVGEGE